jgi:lipopolysaccharide/colanic/teichoic acid biosynthesis glycosyltransferase
MGTELVRRLLDLVLAGLAVLLLWPLAVAIAAWIKVDSSGPVFFRQERVGRHGRLFRIHKFRTMTVAAGSKEGPLITVAGDQRITRVGHILRRSKLDELPQLLDVLAGDMGLVGPRPEVPHYMALVPQALREQLLAVRPGLTDPASVAYADENERLALTADPEREYREVILPAKLALSADYLQQRTLASDLRVLAATVGRLAFGPTADTRHTGPRMGSGTERH